MTELWIIAVSVWCLGLFALGGTELPLFGTGFKWLRRFVLPIGLLILGVFLTDWWRSVGYAVTLCVFLHQGYGDKCPWWKRIVVFTGYGVSALWIGFSWWQIITPVVLSGMFLLSNTKATSKIFQWKYCELAMGLLIAWSFCNSF
jgi:hypothetical protein